MGKIKIPHFCVVTSKAAYDVAANQGHLDLKSFGSGWENQFRIGASQSIASIVTDLQTNLRIEDDDYDLNLSDAEALRIEIAKLYFQSRLGGLSSAEQEFILGQIGLSPSIVLGITLTQLLDNCDCQVVVKSKGKKRREGYISGVVTTFDGYVFDRTGFLIIVSEKDGSGVSVATFEPDLENITRLASLLAEFEECVDVTVGRSKEPETTKNQLSAVKGGSDSKKPRDKGNKNGNKRGDNDERS